MSYHGLGAGPGPTERYYLDMPFPWGENTAVVIPVQEMTKDATREALRVLRDEDLASLVPWNSINTRVQASMPLWVEQAVEEANIAAKPHIDAYINSALVKFAGITTVLMGGAFLVAYSMSRK